MWIIFDINIGGGWLLSTTPTVVYDISLSTFNWLNCRWDSRVPHQDYPLHADRSDTSVAGPKTYDLTSPSCLDDEVRVVRTSPQDTRNVRRKLGDFFLFVIEACSWRLSQWENVGTVLSKLCWSCQYCDKEETTNYVLFEKVQLINQNN